MTLKFTTSVETAAKFLGIKNAKANRKRLRLRAERNALRAEVARIRRGILRERG